MSDNDAIISQIEKWGPDLVRIMIATGRMPAHLVGTASDWLALRDQEARERSESSQALQMRTALSAQRAAWIAAIAAIAAAAIAIIGIIISVLAWVWPR